MKNYTKDELNTILNGYMSKTTSILDWYDGPLLSLAVINGKSYYYYPTDLYNFTVVALRFSDAVHDKGEVFCMSKINALLEQREYYPEVIEEAFTLRFQESGDTIEPIVPAFLPRYGETKCFDLALGEYLIKGKSRIAITNDSTYESDSDYHLMTTSDLLSNVIEHLSLDVACHNFNESEEIRKKDILQKISSDGYLEPKLKFFNNNYADDTLMPSIPVVAKVKLVTLDRTNLESGLYYMIIEFESCELTSE